MLAAFIAAWAIAGTLVAILAGGKILDLISQKKIVTAVKKIYAEH